MNVGAYIGFNAVWQGVVGTSDRRPSEADLAGMRRLVERGLEQGAWGISAGLDYVPGRYARTDEVLSVLQEVRRWRTNFPNHERVTEDTGYSVRAGVAETLTIARAATWWCSIHHGSSTGPRTRIPRRRPRASNTFSSTAGSRSGHAFRPENAADEPSSVTGT